MINLFIKKLLKIYAETCGACLNHSRQRTDLTLRLLESFDKLPILRLVQSPNFSLSFRRASLAETHAEAWTLNEAQYVAKLSLICLSNVKPRFCRCEKRETRINEFSAHR
ncbi:MAG: hypothetical protein LH614_04040 [Pyrinomonadaceae bacterium]|nr:hypothetical protein [Pyrinomonadaceae bacterium]